MIKLTKGVAIMHFGRAGSTLLSNMISQNRLFYNDGELLEKVRVGDIKLLKKPNEDAGSIFNRRRNKYFYRHYLVSVKPIPEEHLRPTLLNMSYSKFIDSLDAAGIDKKIVIARKNYLKHTLSNLLAQEWKKFHFLNNEKPDLKKIHVNVEDIQFGTFRGTLKDLFERYDSYYAIIKSQTSNALFLSYEDDIEKDPFQAFAKAKEYLSLSHKPTVILRKSNTFKDYEVISNYDEVKEYLSDSKFKWMIDS